MTTDVHEGRACAASAEECRLIEEELGFLPTNLLRVSAFHTPLKPTGTAEQQEQEEQRPAVLLLYPLRNGEHDYKRRQRAKVEPFPTIYWLASAELKARVSILEDKQHVQTLQDRLDTDASAREVMAGCHQRYAASRWELLTDRDRELVEAKGWVRPLKDVGIAGIRNFASVKCLHTHYAHYLATKDNLIGQWVQELLDQEAAAAPVPVGVQ